MFLDCVIEEDFYNFFWILVELNSMRDRMDLVILLLLLLNLTMILWFFYLKKYLIRVLVM